MERTVTYRLVLWFESFFDDDSRLLAVDPSDLTRVYDLGDGQIWKTD